MSPERMYLDYLDDIAEALQHSAEFVTGLSFDAFREDTKTVFAVVRALEVVGEATKQISPEVRNRHTQVPWREMAGMRDKLIHQYFGVDLRVVWKTVQEDVLVLIPVLHQVIAEERTREE